MITRVSAIVCFLATIFISFRGGAAKLAPDFIRPCNTTSPSCLLGAVQDAIPEFVKGMPELNVTTLDPFFIKELSITLPGGLKVTYLNGRVSGFRKCIVDSVLSELDKRHFVLGFHCNITIRGQYKANGRILLFPINGDGDAKIKLVNLRMVVDIKTDYPKDDKGLYHFAIKNYTYEFDYGDKVSFVLTNLFKGNPEISNAVLVFLNENWRLVASEFGKPIVEYSVELALSTIGKFFDAVPYEELIDVPFPSQFITQD